MIRLMYAYLSANQKWIVYYETDSRCNERRFGTRERAESEMRMLLDENVRIEECPNCDCLVPRPITQKDPCPVCEHSPNVKGFAEIAKSLDPEYDQN